MVITFCRKLFRIRSISQTCPSLSGSGVEAGMSM
jgi:hypothetical protein